MTRSTSVNSNYQQELNELWAYVYNLKKENRALELKNDTLAVEIVKLQNLIQCIQEPVDRLNRTLKIYLEAEEWV